MSYAQIITEAAKSVSDLHFVVYDGLSLVNADSDCILIGYNAQCCKISNAIRANLIGIDFTCYFHHDSSST